MIFAVILTFAAMPSGWAATPLQVALVSSETELRIAVTPPDSRTYELHVIPDDLEQIETSDDLHFVGEIYLPTNPDISRSTSPHNLISFLHRQTMGRPWTLVMQFPLKAKGTWRLNGFYGGLSGALASAVDVPVGDLLPGENILHYDGWAMGTPGFYYRCLWPNSGEGDISIAAPFARVRVELWLRDESGAATQYIDGTTITKTIAPALPPREPSTSEITLHQRDHLIRAAISVGQNILRAQVPATDPRFGGGFHLVYDDSKRSWRVPHWIWAWGPAIKLLLDLDERLPAEISAPRSTFRAAALAAGQSSLDFETTDPNHPAHGLSTVRWEYSPDTPSGTAEYISAADSLFLAGWAWIPLYQLTGDERYLAHTRDLVSATERLLNIYPTVPQDYVVERQRWTPHTLDESAFAMIGYERLHAATGEPAALITGKRFIDSLLTHMQLNTCFLDRGWLLDEARGFWDPDVKGHLWVLEGYIDAYRLTGSQRYLDLACQLAEKISACQAEDGGWTHKFTKPVAGDPINDRSVAIGAWVFYQLYALTHDDDQLATARRALTWCLRHQDWGPNPDLHGAIPTQGRVLHLSERRMTILYTTAFFGLALLEELDLPPPSLPTETVGSKS